MDCEINRFSILKKNELIEFFGSEPVEISIDDGYFCFEVFDSKNNKLRFSYNLFEKSVQTEIFSNGISIMKTSYEGNVEMKIENKILHCVFCDKLKKTILTVSLKDGIKIDWSTLRLS